MKSYLHVIKFAPTMHDIIIVLGHDEEPRDESGLVMSCTCLVSFATLVFHLI